MTREDRFTIFTILAIIIVCIIALFYGLRFAWNIASSPVSNFFDSINVGNISLPNSERDYAFDIPKSDLTTSSSDEEIVAGRDVAEGIELNFAFAVPSRVSTVVNVQIPNQDAIVEDAILAESQNPVFNDSILNLDPSVQTAATSTTVITDTPQQSLKIQIPRIGLDSPVWEGNGAEDLLQKGFWTYPASGKFGEGEVVMLCHRRYFGTEDSRTCWFLDQVQKGDSIFVTKAGGEQSYKYEIVGVNTFEANDPEIYNIDKNSDYIRLVTCAPLYSNSKRLVVLAKRSL